MGLALLAGDELAVVAERDQQSISREEAEGDLQITDTAATPRKASPNLRPLTGIEYPLDVNTASLGDPSVAGRIAPYVGLVA